MAVADRIMQDLVPGRPYVRVEGGVAPRTFERTARHGPERRGPDDPFTITSAGSLDQANGILELLGAFRILEGPRFRLWIAGDGVLAPAVRRAASEDPRISALGLVPFDDVLGLYRESDVLVNMRLTRRIETRYFFPSKLMEYLASGVPVISTCTGHVEAEFGHCCVLLRDESAAGLGDAIRAMAGMDPEARRAMGARARAFMAAEKSWDAQGRKVAAYLRTVLCQTTRGGRRPEPWG